MNKSEYLNSLSDEELHDYIEKYSGLFHFEVNISLFCYVNIKCGVFDEEELSNLMELFKGCKAAITYHHEDWVDKVVLSFNITPYEDIEMSEEDLLK